MIYTFESLDHILIGMSQELLTKGIWREVRGSRCLEIPFPVVINLKNPTLRYITISARKWNKYLPFCESLWMAKGLNNLNSLPGRYVKNLYNYSDNGTTWRGGYGPRIRGINGISTDYYISSSNQLNDLKGSTMTNTDQLTYIIQRLQSDINTRQAIMQIGDAVKDNLTSQGELKPTKDYPCTRSIQFMMVNGALNCTVYMRSNDLIYGLSGVNVFNWTWMQEYVANILNVPVGEYYHIVNNLHVYEKFVPKLRDFADISPTSLHSYVYQSQINSLSEFDKLTDELTSFEWAVWNGVSSEDIRFNNDMFDDWSNVFLQYKGHNLRSFHNPILNRIFKI